MSIFYFLLVQIVQLSLYFKIDLNIRAVEVLVVVEVVVTTSAVPMIKSSSHYLTSFNNTTLTFHFWLN